MRESGILMHITSLPGPYGIGSMGRSAYEFVDFLQQAGQSYWQLLPLNPTGYGDSPYQAFSSHAGNPYLIDLDTLCQEGLLEREELQGVFWGADPGRVDFGAMYTNRLHILFKAFERFQPDETYAAFVEENRHWLDDYSLFASLKQTLGGTWLQWPRSLMMHEAEALADVRKILDEQVRFHHFLQFYFFKQWQALRAYAAQKGIRIIGDVPIYVPLDSADVWADPKLFQLDENRQPVAVAGCPPDGFSEDGQLWGNPLYNWQALEDTGYSWWLRRLKSASGMYDVIRIDHFRGFESYWSIPAGDKDARGGQWIKGPGQNFIAAVRGAFDHLECIAEDLGFVTPEVRQLQLDSGYPGMKVVEFAFDSREEGNYLPHLYPVDSVCYTGTHDNATLKQWLENATVDEIDHAKAYLGLNEQEGYVWGMIRGGMASISRIFVAQMQDYLQLGAEGRMNQPGTLSQANWTWRAESGFADSALAAKIRSMTALFGRLSE